jgi:hypothetical protein
MTPRGRRLGPEDCVKGITCSPQRREVLLPDAGFDKSGCPRRGDPVAELIDVREGRARTELIHQVGR